MPKTRVVLNHAGFAELLTSAAVRAELKRRAEDLAARAGDGYEVLVNESRSARAGVSVVTATPAARVNEARNHSLLKALGGGAGGSYTTYTSRAGVTSIRSAAEVANYTRGRRG